MSTSLPKDVGLCASCQAPNSRHASSCHNCGETLPWKRAAASTPTAKSAPPPGSLPGAVAPGSFTGGKGGAIGPIAAVKATPVEKVQDMVSNVDWAGAGKAGLIWLVIFVISSGIPIVGFFLYRYWRGEDSPLRHAAAAGLYFTFVPAIGLFLFKVNS